MNILTTKKIKTIRFSGDKALNTLQLEFNGSVQIHMICMGLLLGDVHPSELEDLDKICKITSSNLKSIKKQINK